MYTVVNIWQFTQKCCLLTKEYNDTTDGEHWKWGWSTNLCAFDRYVSDRFGEGKLDVQMWTHIAWGEISIGFFFFYLISRVHVLHQKSSEWLWLHLKFQTQPKLERQRFAESVLLEKYGRWYAMIINVPEHTYSGRLVWNVAKKWDIVIAFTQDTFFYWTMN